MKKLSHTLFLIFLLIAWSPIAQAYTLLTLDAVANAGSASNPYATYLNIVNPTTNQYYYQWSGDSVLPWDSLDSLYSDLADNYLLSLSLPLSAWYLESAGDVFKADARPSILQSVSVSAGAYMLSLFGESAYNLQGTPYPRGSQAGNQWNAYVQFFQNDGPAFAFGDGELSFNSQAGALDYYGTYFTEFYLPQDTTLYYFINDTNSIDNSGRITLALQAVPVPEPTTWFLFLSGAALLACMRRRQGVGSGDALKHLDQSK